MAATFYSWLKTYLKDRGFQLTKSGFKAGTGLGSHSLADATGFWQNVQHSAGKPPRWIYHLTFADGALSASLPNGLDEIGVGQSNTAQGDKAGLAVRILPIIQTGPDAFHRLDEFEINALFMFHGALPAGSSSDAFTFNPTTGVMKRTGVAVDYIFAALIGLRSKDDGVAIAIDGQEQNITYGEVLDAIGEAVQIKTKGHENAEPIGVYDLSADDDLEDIKAYLVDAWDNAGPPPQLTAAAVNAEDAPDDEPLDYSQLNIPENPDLLGIDQAVYRQINAMLKSGKQHLMLYGPPGTGKTSLARWIATNLPGGDWTLITGSSDWSSQDIIGGYQPLGGGEVDFVPGILLRAFDQPLIIDELNRCDIDKVIGPLFTVLSGQQTTLPYRTDISDKESQPYVILPVPKANTAPHEFAPGPGWRLIATINSIDKASLYQMSYALSRRFGWVYVDAPGDLAGFIREFLARLDPVVPAPAAGLPCPLADLWKAINAVRVIGPAPIIDAINAMRAIDPAVDFFGPASPSARSTALDALDMVMLPMLDGIVHQDAMTIAEAAIQAFGFNDAEQAQVRARLEAVAI